jgi:hypothetical protein
VANKPRGIEQNTLACIPALTCKQNPRAKRGYYNVLCDHGNFTHCKLVSAALLGDYPEYSDLHHLEHHVSFSWECPNNAHEDYVPSDKQHARQDHNLNQTLTNANTKSGNAERSSCHGHQ